MTTKVIELNIRSVSSDIYDLLLASYLKTL